MSQFKRVTINFRNPFAIEWINAVPKGTRSATIERICLEHIECPAIVRQITEALSKELDKRQMWQGPTLVELTKVSLEEDEQISVAIDALGEI